MLYATSLIPEAAAGKCFPGILFRQKGFLMIKTTSVLPDFPDFHEFYGYTPEKALFFDIETTGLSHKSACVFLIGTIHLENGSWQLTQYLAEHASEEKPLLETFLSDAAPYDTLIHFNGSTFDVPFLNAKANAYELTGISLHGVSGKSSGRQSAEKSACQTSGAAHVPFSTHPFTAAEKNSLDLYRTLSVLRHLPGQTSLKQSALEKLAGWQRTDTLSGKHMAAMFRSFDKTQDQELLQLMLLHNHDDLVGMTNLLPLAAYCMLADGDFIGVRSCFLRSDEKNAVPSLEVTIQLRAPLPTPLSLSHFSDDPAVSCSCVCDMIVKNSTAVLRFPGFPCELKYFFPDYKNTAIFRSKIRQSIKALPPILIRNIAFLQKQRPAIRENPTFFTGSRSHFSLLIFALPLMQKLTFLSTVRIFLISQIFFIHLCSAVFRDFFHKKISLFIVFP